MQAAPAEEHFCSACRRRIVRQDDRPSAVARNLAVYVEAPPAIHDLARRADLGFPIPQLEGGSDPEAHDASEQERGEIARQRGQILAQECRDLFRRRIGVEMAAPRPHRAREIHEIKVAAAPADLEAEGEGSVGIERKRHRWLADPAAPRAAPQEKGIRFEPVDDRRHRLGREARESCNLSLRKPAMTANEREDEALIIEPHPALVGAAVAIGRARRSRSGKSRFVGELGRILAHRGSRGSFTRGSCNRHAP